MPLCKCGCGQLRPEFDRKGRPREYIKGHQNRPDGYIQPIQNIINGKNYCLCGCGEMMSVRNSCGRRLRFKRGHMNRMESNKRFGEERYNWNGGKFIDSQGYVMTLNPNHPRSTIRGYVHEHVLVMEKHLRRYLDNGEQIHHINGDKTDNRIENLQLMTITEHSRYHAQKKKGLVD